MKKIILFCVTGVIALSAFSCKKYEEGPAISLHTKKSRLTGFWKLESYIQNGVDVTATVQSSFGTDATWQYKPDGTYHISGNADTDGTWTFEEKKTQLLLGTGDLYDIIRLTQDELWLRYAGDADTDLIKYKQ